MLSKCIICGNKSNIKCKNCTQEAVCNDDHLKQHLILCKNTKIVKNNEFGRHLVADRTIKSGEIIFKDVPKLIGPKTITKPVCLNCYEFFRNDEHILSCYQCGIVPICSSRCTGIGHSKDECDFFQKKFRNLNFNFIIENFQVILVLKFLSLKFYQPTIWKQLINLEAHLVERKRNETVWNFYETYFTKVIEQLDFLTKQEIENKIVQKICGILDVNSFELRVPPKSPTASIVKNIRGIYLKASLISHECIGNIMISIDDNYTMIIRAKNNIHKNEPLFFNYGDFLKSTNQRQEFIKEGKYFDCKCRRCLDPTEFNTFLSSLRCPRCKIGFLIKNLDLQSDSNWQCNNKSCRHNFQRYLIEITINYIEDLIQSVDKTSVTAMECLLKKLQRTLTDNHSLLIELKQILINLYSTKIANEDNYSHYDICRNIELLNDMLNLVNKLDPCNTRFKGLNMYQIHIPIVMKANKNFNEKRINSSQLCAQLLEAESYLKNAIKFLLYEPKNSVEGRLTKTALSELQILRDSIRKIKLFKR